MKPFVSVTVLSLAVCAAGCSPSSTEGVGEAASSAMSEVGEAASDAAGSVKDAAGDAVATAKESVEEGMAAVMDKASGALANIEGGPELLKKATGLFDSAKETLRGITDTETAQAAVAKLTDLEGSIEGLSDSMSSLPGEAKTALAAVIEKGAAGLKALVEKVLAIPGVQEVIKPKLDEVMQKLSALTGRK